MPDAHKNFAASLVATAPSPATSGGSLVVTAGDGALFPTPPFNVTICPAGTAPTTANAEVARCTAKATDTLTITRTQEGTSARTIVVGDQIFAGITAQTLTDAEAAASLALRDTYLRPSTISYETISRAGQINTAGAVTSGTMILMGIALPKGAVISNITWMSGGTGATTPTHWWFSLHDSSRVMLAVTADQTTTAWASSTAKTLSIATIASGASATFTTTYEGLHYLGFEMTATTPISLINAAHSGGIGASFTPVLGGNSTTGQTTPPAFPFTAAALTATNSAYYAGVA